MAETEIPNPNRELLQGILFHLGEMRARLKWAMVSLVITTIVSFIFVDEFLLFLTAPYGVELQTLRPTEGIETYFKVALLSGAIVAMPFILLQVWIFIAEGLEKREKRYVYIFVPAATILFLVGVAFSWFVLIPTAIRFLSGFQPDIFVAEWTSDEYIGFITNFIFWLGVSFEMPLIFYFLARVGTVTARGLRDQWRIAIVGTSILAAVITPSIDPVTMLLTMLPLLVLYFLSILMARLGERQFERSVALDSSE